MRLPTHANTVFPVPGMGGGLEGITLQHAFVIIPFLMQKSRTVIFPYTFCSFTANIQMYSYCYNSITPSLGQNITTVCCTVALLQHFTEIITFLTMFQLLLFNYHQFRFSLLYLRKLVRHLVCQSERNPVKMCSDVTTQ
jgi:hypothetical protein